MWVGVTQLRGIPHALVRTESVVATLQGCRVYEVRCAVARGQRRVIMQLCLLGVLLTSLPACGAHARFTPTTHMFRTCTTHTHTHSPAPTHLTTQRLHTRRQARQQGVAADIVQAVCQHSTGQQLWLIEVSHKRYCDDCGGVGKQVLNEQGT